MVSVEHLRDEALRLRHEERNLLNASRKRKLRELYAVVRHVEFQRDFPPLPQLPIGSPIPPYLSWDVTDEAEQRFLDGNNFLRGFSYDERTLPKPLPRPPEPIIETNGAYTKSISPTTTAPINAPSPTTQLPLTPAPSTEEHLSISQPGRLSIDAGVVDASKKPRHPPSPVDEPSAPSSLESSHAADSVKDRWQSVDTTSEATTITPPHERQTPSPPSLSPSRPHHKPQDHSAPIAVIGGVPVIQSIHPEASAQSKGSKDGILVGPEAAVHPPPPPKDIGEPKGREEPLRESGASSLPSPQESSAVLEDEVVVDGESTKPLSQEKDDERIPEPPTDISSMKTVPAKTSELPSGVSSDVADPNAQLRLELEMAKKEPSLPRDDIEMGGVSKPAESAKSVLQEELAPKPLTTVEEGPAKPLPVNKEEGPVAVSEDIVMKDTEPPRLETEKPSEPTSKEIDMPEAKAERSKADLPLADSSESAINVQRAVPVVAEPAKTTDDAITSAVRDVNTENVDVSSSSPKRLSGGLAEEQSLVTLADQRLSDKRLSKRRTKAAPNIDPYLIRQKFALRNPKDIAEDADLKEASKAISLYKRQPQQQEPLSLLRLLYTIDSSASLQKALTASHKTLNTQNHALAFSEVVAQRVLNRVLQLEDSGKWGLRQPPRVPEPKRKKTHWDFVLQEARWLREDFNEERKWKIATARTVALWCQDWNEASPEERKSMQVRARIPIPRIEEISEKEEEAGSKVDSAVEKPKDLANGNDDVDMDNSARVEPKEAEQGEQFVRPSDLSTPFDITGGKSLLESLIDDGIPIYKPPILPSEDVLEEGVEEPWALPIAPVSKYLTAKVNIVETKYTRKRSRFEYDPNPELYAEDSGGEDDDLERPRKRTQTRRPTPDAPLQTDCALFSPSAKSILNRAAQASALKPPGAAYIPPATFFSSRQPSQWTAQDDEALKEAIAAYPQNWPLVSCALTPKGEFHSSVERRSPWEAFERHVSMLDSLPPEFTKNQFYRGIQQRLEWAAKGGEIYVNPPAGGQGSGQNTPTVKRKGTTPIRIEKKRNTRALNLVEAMRRLAKKKEASVSKQHNAAVRKPDANAGTKTIAAQTPEHFSKLKYEHEMKLRMKLQQQQLLRQHPQALAHHQALAAKVAAQGGAVGNIIPAAHPNGVGAQQMHRAPAVPHMANVPQGAAVPVPHGVPHPNLLAVPRAANQIPPNYTQEQLQRIVMENNRLKAQQLQATQAAQAQAAQAAQAQAMRDSQQHSSPVPMPAGLPMNYNQQNGANIMSQAHLLQAQQQQAAMNSVQANGQKSVDHLPHTAPTAPRAQMENQVPVQAPMNPWVTQSTATASAPQHQLQLPQSLAAQNVNSAQQMQEYHKRLHELMRPGAIQPGHHSPNMQNGQPGHPMTMQQQQMYQIQMLRQQNAIQQVARQHGLTPSQQAAAAQVAANNAAAAARVGTPQQRPGSVGSVGSMPNQASPRMNQASPRMNQVQQVGGHQQGQ